VLTIGAYPSGAIERKRVKQKKGTTEKETGPGTGRVYPLSRFGVKLLGGGEKNLTGEKVLKNMKRKEGTQKKKP